MNRMGRLEERVGVEKAALMCRYMDAVLEKNRFINLTAILDRDEFIVKHLLDSLTILDLPEFRAAKTVVDVGTGSGFPGVPLAIACPEKDFVLIDSLNKRLRVISELTEALDIRNVRTLHARAEDAGRDADCRDGFDLCVSRAVASMDVLAEWCLPLVRKGGFFVAMKGEKTEAELAEGAAAIRALAGEVVRVESAEVDETAEAHTLILIRKTGKTPAVYPRKAGTARKDPIRGKKK
ncbi:MAG: 16S rRNA (guanine(527)-N(7))-methyltransferase RsmG [Mogibacterium sp.]|nr:16S rRNA (guanine(527)-N(7))-methyltransferase RsmG [Mogibacterium sp.]